MAAAKNWDALVAKNLGLTATLGRILSSAASCNPDISGPSLVVTSDYSGSHRDSAYEVYSILVADLVRSNQWRTMREHIRTRLPDGRRMSYKALNDKHRRRVIKPFLAAADSIPGICASLAVAKDIDTLFEHDNTPVNSELAACLCWNRHLFERALRIIHFVSFFVCGLSLPNQDVLWFSDEDEIAANPERLALLTKVWGNVMSNYALHSFRHLRCGTTASDDGSHEIEDLAAIPDLAAGALADLLTPIAGQLRTGVTIPGKLDSKAKANNIGQWLSDNNSQLKKVALVIDKRPNSTALTISRVQFHDLSSMLSVATL